MSDTDKDTRSARGEALQQLQSVKQNTQGAIGQKRQDLYLPLNQKAQSAIAAVAQAHGYDYVVDDQTSQFLYVRKTTNDLFPAAKSKLSVK